jgi:hypothetical protein
MGAHRVESFLGSSAKQRILLTAQCRGDVRPILRLLTQAAEDGAPVMFADIAMRRALNADGEPDRPEPRRKRAKKYKVIR